MFFRSNISQPQTRLSSIPIDKIHPNPNQPRRYFDQAALEELSHSIRQYGLMQPVLVRECKDQYELIAGERRWRACKLAGLTKIDALITQADSEKSAYMALVENLQRRDLHFFEEAESYLALMSLYGMTQEQLAASLGKDQSTVANKMRVFRLSGEVKKEVMLAGLSERHARALLKLRDSAAQLQAVEKIKKKQLSVKETEKMIEGMLEEPKRSNAKLVALVKDYRLFVNTMKSACKTLQAAGVQADFKVEETQQQVQVVVSIPKEMRGRMTGS